MERELIEEKLKQATELVAQSGVDVWLTFVRETAEGSDPVLPFLIEGSVTWQSAFLITKTGRRIAIVGNYDADPLQVAGHWDEVVPYVQSIKEPLLEVLHREVPSSNPKVAINSSVNDVKADGLTHGMFLLLKEYVSGTKFEGTLESAEAIVRDLRGVKTPGEIARIVSAIGETVKIFKEVEDFVYIGRSEREVFDFIQERIDQRGFGYGWDRVGNPIVNSGPDSMVGHGIPSESITISPGHIFHIDLGVRVQGYSSDIQRCWYVPHSDEDDLPEDVLHATLAVVGAIQTGLHALKPGVEGWRVDEAAREYLVAAGYPEYQHALGHQVGRVAHDGGTILGPQWERYGKTPYYPVKPGEVYTLELGVMIAGRGYLGLEEMAVVTEDGCDWLTEPQREMPMLGR